MFGRLHSRNGWWKDPAEKSCSPPGSQEAERKEPGMKGHMTGEHGAPRRLLNPQPQHLRPVGTFRIQTEVNKQE